jgi:hypothetical protein
MSKPSVTRLGCATVYGALYVATYVFAVQSLAAPGGGIPFVLPLFLGLPWTLIVSALFLVPQIPKPAISVLIFVVPPMINVLLILWARGTAKNSQSFRLVRATRAKTPEAGHPPEGTHAHTEPHDSDWKP